MTDFHIDVANLDKIEKAFEQFPHAVEPYLKQAGEEAGHEVIQTRGLQQYPPAGPQNSPPPPYYIRGRGTQTSAGHNTGRSEKYGSQFYVESRDYLTTAIGNRASYAPYLADKERQTIWAPIYGWRALIDVAQEKVKRITAIFQGWVDKCIKDLELK